VDFWINTGQGECRISGIGDLSPDKGGGGPSRLSARVLMSGAEVLSESSWGLSQGFKAVLLKGLDLELEKLAESRDGRE